MHEIIHNTNKRQNSGRLKIKRGKRYINYYVEAIEGAEVSKNVIFYIFTLSFKKLAYICIQKCMKMFIFVNNWDKDISSVATLEMLTSVNERKYFVFRNM